MCCIEAHSASILNYPHLKSYLNINLISRLHRYCYFELCFFYHYNVYISVCKVSTRLSALSLNYYLLLTVVNDLGIAPYVQQTML